MCRRYAAKLRGIRCRAVGLMYAAFPEDAWRYGEKRMSREHESLTVLSLVLTLCNVAVAFGTVTAFGTWQSGDHAVPTPPVPPRPQPHKLAPPGPGPVVYFVASQDQADSLAAFFAANTASSLGVPRKVMVVRSDAAAARLRQAIADRNARRTAAGRAPIQIMDVRGLSTAAEETIPEP